jgi:hypothetical protein
MGCKTCARVRAHLPSSIRARLEEVERRIETKKRKDRIAISYTTAKQPAPSGAPGACSPCTGSNGEPLRQVGEGQN